MAVVEGVFLSPGHRMAKQPQDVVRLLPGIGIDGDAHAGTTVRANSTVSSKA